MSNTFLKLVQLLPLLAISSNFVHARIHTLILKNDDRTRIPISTFGYVNGGLLAVNGSLSYKAGMPVKTNTSFGFLLFKGMANKYQAFLDAVDKKGGCVFTARDMSNKLKDMNLVIFRMDFTNNKIYVDRIGDKLQTLQVSGDMDSLEGSVNSRRKRGSKSMVVMSHAVIMQRKKRDGSGDKTPNGDEHSETLPSDGTKKEKGPTAGDKEKTAPPEIMITELILNRVVNISDEIRKYKFNFGISFRTDDELDEYNLYFHNCLKKADSKDNYAINVLNTEIVENNQGNYLSAGSMPLPTLYFTFSCVFFLMAGVWVSYIKKYREDCFKVHYMMAVVVSVKSLTLLFHGVNLFYIQQKGEHEAAWLTMYYIAYLIRVTLLFVTILLIGAGWAFIKHMLSDKEKKLFIIFIPLQILANVLYIIMMETEEGSVNHFQLMEMFIIVDLLCCGAILFPVVWSIRHLQEASQTDGKAAISLNKLRLFRHFYILVVCYIYSTRIIVYVLRITLPYNYIWLMELFLEIAMIVFYVVTGLKFRPTPDNPYLQVPQDSDDEVEMEEVLTVPGALETVTKVNQKSEDDQTKVNKRESSHDYD